MELRWKENNMDSSYDRSLGFIFTNPPPFTLNFSAAALAHSPASAQQEVLYHD